MCILVRRMEAGKSAMVGEDGNACHVVWGQIEQSSGSSSNCKDSSSHSSAGRSGENIGRKNLSREVRRYLENGVTIEDSDDSGSECPKAHRTRGSGGISEHQWASADAARVASSTFSSGSRGLPGPRPHSGILAAAAIAVATSSSSSSESLAVTLRAPIGAASKVQLETQLGRDGEAFSDDGGDLYGPEEGEELGDNVFDSVPEEQQEMVLALIREHMDDLAADLWSRGSVRHNDGKCRPCHYIQTKDSCLNGKDCEFCHLPHKKLRLRPSKNKRAKCKKFIQGSSSASHPTTFGTPSYFVGRSASRVETSQVAPASPRTAGKLVSL